MSSLAKKVIEPKVKPLTAAQQKKADDAAELAELESQALRKVTIRQANVLKRAAEIDHRTAGLKDGEVLRLENVEDVIYHETKGVGSSLMKAASKSMALYKAMRDGTLQYSAAQEKIFDLGSGVHDHYILPLQFGKNYVIMPEGLKRGTNAFKRFKLKYPLKTVLDQDQFEAVTAIVKNMQAHPELTSIATGSKGEVSYWKQHNGLILKARTDMETSDLIIDLKSTKDAEPKKFARTVKYDYSIQDALYRFVTGINDMIYVGAGKSQPFDIFFSMQGEDVRHKSEIILHETIANIHQAEASGIYPGIPFELITTELYDSEKI